MNLNAILQSVFVINPVPTAATLKPMPLPVINQMSLKIKLYFDAILWKKYC